MPSNVNLHSTPARIMKRMPVQHHCSQQGTNTHCPWKTLYPWKNRTPGFMSTDSSGKPCQVECACNSRGELESSVSLTSVTEQQTHYVYTAVSILSSLPRRYVSVTNACLWLLKTTIVLPLSVNRHCRGDTSPTFLSMTFILCPKMYFDRYPAEVLLSDGEK